ncbi:hypothetical protein Tco_0848636, partial [Tanacetum coccineum]
VYVVEVYVEIDAMLKYVPSYKEIEVYVEKHTMEVVSGKGKGVVIEEIIEDDEVNEASKTGYRGQSLLLNENDVETVNMDSTSKVDHPPWSSRSLSDSGISEHPPWSSESMNEKRNKRWSEEFWFRIQLFENNFVFGLDLSQDHIDMTKVVKAEQEMQEPVYYNFHPLIKWIHMIGNKILTMEMMKLKRTQSCLLECFPFLNDELKEYVVGVDAPVVAVEEQLERIEHVVDEEIERSRKRKRENEDKSASANVLPFGKIKQEEKVKSSSEGREGNEILWFLFAYNVVVESFKLIKELQDDELEKSREMMLQSCDAGSPHRSCSKDVDDPVDFALAYREKMVITHEKRKRDAGSMSSEELVAWMTLKDVLYFPWNRSASFSARPANVPMSVGSPAGSAANAPDEDLEIAVAAPVANNAVGAEVIPPLAGRHWRGVVARPVGSPWRVITPSSDVDSKGKRVTFPNFVGSPSFKKRKHVVLD